MSMMALNGAGTTLRLLQALAIGKIMSLEVVRPYCNVVLIMPKERERGNRFFYPEVLGDQL